MSILEAIILGILQGATEFLPISSSGHLVLIPYLFNLTEPGLTMISIVHEGTLLAVLVYFRRDLWEIIKGVLEGLRRRQPLATAESRLGWFIVLGSIPAAAAGLLFADFFEEVFGTPAISAGFLLVTAVFLVTGERLMTGKKNLTHLTWLDALIVGFFQMLALFPGISRSGSTITAGLMRGFDRATAARFSFLLGIPAILGAGLLSVLDILQVGNLGSEWPAMLAGFVAAAVSGYACIHFLLAWLKQRSLTIFVVYVTLLSAISFLVIILRG